MLLVLEHIVSPIQSTTTNIFPFPPPPVQGLVAPKGLHPLFWNSVLAGALAAVLGEWIQKVFVLV